MESAVAMIVIPGIGGSEMSEELNGLSRELFSIFDVSCFPFQIGLFFALYFSGWNTWEFLLSILSRWKSFGIFSRIFLKLSKIRVVSRNVEVKFNRLPLYYLCHYLSYKTFIDSLPKISIF